MLLFDNGSPPAYYTELHQFGKDFGTFWAQAGYGDEQLSKVAYDTPVPVYCMSGTLYATPKGWILLSVPNALVRGVFDSMDEPGIELPTDDERGRLNAHISVMRPEEVDRVGGIDRVTERGHRFSYTLGPLKTVQPAGWDAVSRVWYIEVKSPELQQLRRSYGLTPLPHNNEFQFHITVAVRRKGVLRTNDISKARQGDSE